ncbi:MULTISPECIES: hypothetical protein [unclassified Leucobacter]|uniref:hypothetical protein n=1 Tax=unclassified Leucobacter TaxID=2621730 RepID=UPI0006210745|nr:hypothetical protein [Leucobacter sp. Ag1]KKI20564.1 hypothetical protein XM48_07555 [Leucobacter sp. Ag1]
MDKELLSGHRRPRWLIDLLDKDDATLKTLEGVEDGEITRDATTQLRGSAQLTIVDRGQGINWLQHRCRFRYDPGISGVEPWSWGVYIFASPNEKHSDGPVIWDVELATKLAILDEDKVDATYSLAEGTPVVAAVQALIESAGETRFTVTPSAALLKSQRVWEANTSKLSIINDLLDAIGYWALWVDREGQFRVEPYVNPKDRQPVWDFTEGETSIHEPDWGRGQDLSGVPNKYTVTTSGSEDEEAIVGVAKNEDPNSPFSYQARGDRWIADGETAEVEDEAAAKALAERRLADRMAPVASITVSHLLIPIDPNDVVTFDSDGHQTTASVQSMRIGLDLEALCEAQWREL